MDRRKVALCLLVAGALMLVVGFVPLTGPEIVTEQKVKEVVQYREETKTREEPYTEETVVGTETREDVLLNESVFVMRASTLGRTFDLTAGDVIRIKAHADGLMMLSFSGQGDMYMTLETGKDIEKEITIRKDGEHTLLFSPAAVTEDITIDFDIVRVHEVPLVEKVEKTRTVEYVEKVPYTEEVPYTEQTVRKGGITTYLRYAGVVVMGVGVVMAFLKGPRKSKKRKSRK